VEYQWHDLVGNLGVGAVLLTYALVQAGRMEMRALAYSGLNALGAILITISLMYDFNLSSFLIEMVWFVISCYGVWRALRESHTTAT
jgi:hypothetical protein